MINESTINIVDYKVLGKLPDPFLRPDGTRVKNVSEWSEQRKELYKKAVEIQYGTMPPNPEFVDVDVIYDGGDIQSLKITAGTKAKPVTFFARLFLPSGPKPYMTVVDGDLCFNEPFKDNFCFQLSSNRIMYAVFDRTQLANDKGADRHSRKGQLYDAYPDYTFSALGAWAWGYMRVTDALIKLGYVDLDCLAYTGHSRGGKTALLAGVLDERAVIVNPNDSGAGGAGCYRVYAETTLEQGGSERTETITDLLTNLRDWVGPDMDKYNHNEDKLPFDNHFLKALIAPRVLLDASAASDGWANPVGTWQTTMAAKEVYKFLGKEQNLIWYYRNGGHAHNTEDLSKLIDVMKRVKFGSPNPSGCFVTPFKQPDLIFDWRAPEAEE